MGALKSESAGVGVWTAVLGTATLLTAACCAYLWWTTATQEHRIEALLHRQEKLRDWAQHVISDVTVGGPRARRVRRGADLPGSGVTYVRWGRKVCRPGATLVYKGRVGGEHYSHRGGGSNYVCLPERINYQVVEPGDQLSGYLYRTEYEFSDAADRFRRLHDRDAPCAVCLVSNSAPLMIPGTHSCPAGRWKREYRGYLVTAAYNQKNQKAFECLDMSAEGLAGSAGNHDGARMYLVQSRRRHPNIDGEFVDYNEIPCVVCTLRPAN